MSVNTHCHQTPIMFGTRNTGRSQTGNAPPQAVPQNKSVQTEEQGPLTRSASQPVPDQPSPLLESVRMNRTGGA